MTNQQELEKYALQVMEAEKSLQQSEEFKAFLVKKKQVDDQVAEAKKILKDKMLELGMKSIVSPLGKEDWNITLSTATSIKCDDLSAVDEQYITKTELDTDDIIVEDGKIYQKTGNTKLVKNLVDSGMSMPEGFSKVVTPRISIKVNGKAV